MKEKNKILLTTSLFSVFMHIISFSVMADGSMEQGDKLASTIKTINAEQNTAFPQTDNTTALYTSDKDDKYRVTRETESFVFYDADGKAINVDNSVKPATYNKAVGYKLTGTEAITDSGFIVGHKEIEDAGNSDGYKGKFFRYWSSSIESEDEKGKIYPSDGQFSPSFPKLCYTGSVLNYPTENKMINKNGQKVPAHPLIRIASVGGDDYIENKMEYINERELSMPVVPMSKEELKTNTDLEGIAFVDAENSTLLCDTKKKGCTLTWDAENNCMRINPFGAFKLVDPDNFTNGYNYLRGQEYKGLVNCEDGSSTSGCADTDVKSFRRNNSGEAYRISQFVRLDITGNKEPIEIPQKTCFRCLNVQTLGVEDTSCSYIVDEVFEAKGGDCAATVAALAVDPRAIKEYLPANMNSEYNCKTCLCKIEELLKAKGCN